MKTDLFVYHGYTEFHLGGRWVKATCAFPARLCRRFGVPPLDFDGETDALFQPLDIEGKRFMEYVAYHGTYADLPFDEIRRAMLDAYPGMYGMGNAEWGVRNGE